MPLDPQAEILTSNWTRSRGKGHFQISRGVVYIFTT